MLVMSNKDPDETRLILDLLPADVISCDTINSMLTNWFFNDLVILVNV